MRLLFYAIGSLAWSFAANAGPTEIGEFGGFTLFRGDERCSIIANFDGDETMVVSYDASLKAANIAFTNHDATSLGQGDKRTLNVYFVDGGRLDDGWEGTEFTASVEDSGDRMLISQNLDPAFLQDFAEGSGIGFFYGDKKITSYDLKGSAAAISALRNCSIRTRRTEPERSLHRSITAHNRKRAEDL